MEFSLQMRKWPWAHWGMKAFSAWILSWNSEELPFFFYSCFMVLYFKPVIQPNRSHRHWGVSFHCFHMQWRGESAASDTVFPLSPLHCTEDPPWVQRSSRGENAGNVAGRGMKERDLFPFLYTSSKYIQNVDSWGFIHLFTVLCRHRESCLREGSYWDICQPNRRVKAQGLLHKRPWDLPGSPRSTSATFLLPWNNLGKAQDLLPSRASPTGFPMSGFDPSIDFSWLMFNNVLLLHLNKSVSLTNAHIIHPFNISKCFLPLTLNIHNNFILWSICLVLVAFF